MQIRASGTSRPFFPFLTQGTLSLLFNCGVILISYSPFLASPQSHVGSTTRARLSASALWSRARAGGMNHCTVWPPLCQEAVLFTAQTEAFEVAAGGCHPLHMWWKKEGAEEECRAGDLHREAEYKAGNRRKEEHNQGGRAARKVNPAISINHFRNAEMNQSEGLDHFHLWYQSICQQTDILCGLIWSLQWGKLCSLQKHPQSGVAQASGSPLAWDSGLGHLCTILSGAHGQAHYLRTTCAPVQSIICSCITPYALSYTWG